MEISTRCRDNVAILDITGEIVGGARFAFNDAIQAQLDVGHNGIIINFNDYLVPMMDSVGLGMLIAAQRSVANKKGGRIVLLNVGRSVRYLLTITKLDQIFDKYDDEEEAVESFVVAKAGAP